MCLSLVIDSLVMLFCNPFMECGIQPSCVCVVVVNAGQEVDLRACLRSSNLPPAYFWLFVPPVFCILAAAVVSPAYLRLEVFLLSYAVNLPPLLSLHHCSLKGQFASLNIHLGG